MNASVYKSKTAIFNLFVAMISIVAMSTSVEVWWGNVGGVTAIAVLNIILRFFTKVPVKV